jgi:uncharacterized 2Fe-2S/4Fe-4S cluster protein (DUF4445 family)
MPVLSVISNNHPVLSFQFSLECNLFKLLTAYEQTRVRSACQKKGVCGLCLVRIEQGEVSALTHHEYERLTRQQQDQGIRLACQVKVTTDVSVKLINPLMIMALDEPPVSSPLPNARYAVAIDLGSTQIRISLWDTVHQQRIAIYCCFNPQSYYGTDILTRLMEASKNDSVMRIMSKLILSTIDRVIRDWTGSKNLQVEEILIVGNTAMLALLAKKHCDKLLEPDYWTQVLDCSLAIKTLRQIPIAIVQPLAGFVGSDLLAGVLATELTHQTESALFIDFGTNSELALWYSGTLWITSVPGGPAFEGCGISCGVAAEIGAVGSIIYDVQLNEFNGALIGHSDDIKGLCGSALCDVMACLVTAGLLRKNGRFTQPVSELEIRLVNLDYSFILKKRDIDIFQRAKAATGAGIAQLLAVAGASVTDLKRVCIGGAFGQFLNIAHAQKIGLLPCCDIEIVELCGNTALTGCEQLLVSDDKQNQLNTIRQHVNIVNMSQLISYEEAFINNLYLQAIPLN